MSSSSLKISDLFQQTLPFSSSMTSEVHGLINRSALRVDINAKHWRCEEHDATATPQAGLNPPHPPDTSPPLQNTTQHYCPQERRISGFDSNRKGWCSLKAAHTKMFQSLFITAINNSGSDTEKSGKKTNTLTLWSHSAQVYVCLLPPSGHIAELQRIKSILFFKQARRCKRMSFLLHLKFLHKQITFNK